MRTAVDTNVFSALWSNEPGASEMIAALGQARSQGGVVICGAVYAELLAHPNASAAFVDDFLHDTGVTIEFDLGEVTWHDVARVYAAYAQRRRRSGSTQSKRLLVDFLIGAHAMHRADRLLTLDASRYVKDFPRLKLGPVIA